MRVNHILSDNVEFLTEEKGLVGKIAHDCRTFLRESCGLPLFKFLPETYGDLQKVKVRKHKTSSKFTQTFNEAFEHDVKDLRQRAVFTDSVRPADIQGKNLFYVFPRDGYKYMYCTEVRHSTDDYKQVFDSLFEQFEETKAEQLIHDLLKFSYVRSELHEGIKNEAEIIFYNIPYYYAARVASFEYDDLLTRISQ